MALPRATPENAAEVARAIDRALAEEDLSALAKRAHDDLTGRFSVLRVMEDYVVSAALRALS